MSLSLVGGVCEQLVPPRQVNDELDLPSGLELRFRIVQDHREPDGRRQRRVSDGRGEADRPRGAGNWVERCVLVVAEDGFVDRDGARRTGIPDLSRRRRNRPGLEQLDSLGLYGLRFD